MNAHKFVAEKRIKDVKHAIKEADAYGCDWIDVKTLEIKKYIPSGDSVFVSELKQVVESLDIVDKHGGLFCLKCQIEKGGYDFEWYGENREFGFTDLNVLEKAIADYELVESYKDSKND